MYICIIYTSRRMANNQEEDNCSFLTIDEIKTEPPDFDFVAIDEGQLTSSITVKEEIMDTPTIKQEFEMKSLFKGHRMTTRSFFQSQIKMETPQQHCKVKNSVKKIRKTTRTAQKLANGKAVSKRKMTETEFQCNKCHRYLSSYKHLKRHINSVHEKNLKKLRCKFCNKEMKNDIHLRLHEKYVHIYDYNTVNEIQCEECGKVVVSRRKLMGHVSLMHIQPTMSPYICDFCNFISKTKNSLRVHISKCHIIYTGKNKPKCKYCNATFKYRIQLRNHLRTLKCIQLLPIKCEYCGRMLKNENTLSNHIWQYHTGSQAGKTFPCVQCDKKYLRKSDLTKHVREEHEKRLGKHKCPYCKSNFKARSILNVHIKYVHKKIDIFQCELCNRSYIRPQHLKRHIKESHVLKYDKKI